MKRKEENFSAPVVGGGALLVIFAVLCLTVFAVLSLSTVQANTRISQKSAAAAQEYYVLDTRAEGTLAALRRGEKPQGVSLAGGVYSYEEANADKTQALKVEVRADGSYAIVRWQLVSTADWKPDTSQHLWNGSAG